MPETAFHVAVVDDDLPVLTALARLLSASSFDPAIYESAQEFIESLKFSVPECLVVDIHMPDMNGIELQNHLTCQGFRIPTIVITARDDLELRAQAAAAGAIEFLVKPLPETRIVDALRKVTRKTRASSEQ